MKRLLIAALALTAATLSTAQAAPTPEDCIEWAMRAHEIALYRDAGKNKDWATGAAALGVELTPKKIVQIVDLIFDHPEVSKIPPASFAAEMQITCLEMTQ